mgnify:FL=1|tara:strand:+ start:1743 stop:2474 length:732 start_codon:yes stop_codon:yes gene_type:complete
MNFDFKKYTFPFDHYVVDNFLPEETAELISNEFISYSNENWFVYKNQIENKKTLQDWGKFPKHTYKLFNYFCSSKFVEYISKISGIDNLYVDQGLHGGGWHMHGTGGNLNIHKDYSIHPKLGLQRKLNLIIYISKDWNPDWGGALEFWSHDHDNNKPLRLEKSIECVYNRAVLFDTTQNSWHGLPNPLTCPNDKYRKSLAMYYLTDIDNGIEDRSRALFAPTKEQENDPDILQLIEERSKCTK